MSSSTTIRSVVLTVTALKNNYVQNIYFNILIKISTEFDYVYYKYSLKGRIKCKVFISC